MQNFEKSLEFGKTGESAIAEFLKRRGFNILPVYEKIDNENKGPTLFMADGSSIIAPDMLVFGNGKTIWIEAKHKTAFTWHRITQRWVTGIDRHHYHQYLKIAEASEWPVWLLFLHKNGSAKDTPPGFQSPTGLFGNEIFKLSKSINHTSRNWGKNGMVYWWHESLIFLAGAEG